MRLQDLDHENCWGFVVLRELYSLVQELEAVAQAWDEAWTPFASFLVWPSAFTARMDAAQLAFQLGIEARQAEVQAA